MGIARSSVFIERQTFQFGKRSFLLFVSLVGSLIVYEALHFDNVDGLYVVVRRVNEDIKLIHYNCRRHAE